MKKLLGTLTLTMLAGCGGGGGPRPTPKPTSTPTPLPTATPTAIPTPTPLPCSPTPAPTKFVASPFRTSGIVFAVLSPHWGQTHWSDLDNPVVTEKNGLTCQNPDCSQVLIFLGLNALKTKGGFTVSGDNGAQVRMRYTGTTINSVETLREANDCPPTPGPTPTPLPTGTPGPTPPPTGPSWPGDIDASCKRQGADGIFRARVDAAVDEAVRERAVSFPWNRGEVALFTALNPYLFKQGLATGVYGTEELAVQDWNGSPFSENNDLLLADHTRRSGMGMYRSTCAPATRSSAVPGGGGPVPTPKPTATPGPTPSPTPPSGRYPAPIVSIEAKVIAQPQPGRYVIDGTAKSCGPNPDFPARNCWPSCGPEGAHPPGCDAGQNPVWTGECSGVPWCGGNSNPWQFRSDKHGSRAKVCAQGVCSNEVVVP